MRRYVCDMSLTIDLFTAIHRMKEFTKAGVQFSIEFYTLDGKLRQIESTSLRPGLSDKLSKRWKFLIGYTDESTLQHRQFHRSLLMKLNNYKITRK